MLSRALNRIVVRLSCAVLLFAQVALAMAACDIPVRAPVQAYAAAGEPSCHEAPARNVNLCLAHCLDEDRSVSTPQLLIPALAQQTALTVAAAATQPSAAVFLGYTLPPQPPPRIRFQTLRL